MLFGEIVTTLWLLVMGARVLGKQSPQT